MLHASAIRTIALIAVAISTATACQELPYSSYENIDADKFEVNSSIERLAALVPEGGIYDVKSDMVIEGAVTANDEYYNFYQSYILQAGEYAIEIREGISNSHVRHRMGYIIAVRLQGLRVARYKGVMQIGLPATVGAEVIPFGFLPIADIYTYNRERTEEVVPKQMTIEQLSTMQKEEIEMQCGRVVTITGLRYAPALINDWGLAYVDNVWSGYKPFVEATVAQGAEKSDDAIWVNTNSYARFSAIEIPDTEINITGILYYGAVGSEGNYATAPIIKMRSKEDVTSTKEGVQVKL